MTNTSAPADKSPKNGKKAAVYVSGPMTGLPDLNRPKFNSEADLLRAQGFTVVNPAESVLPESATWKEHMREDIRAMLDCDRIHMLPGWERSRGAVLELTIAHALGFTVTNAKR